jgi:dipeptidyl aminopeptidase/acylaminoacyl peptidase
MTGIFEFGPFRLDAEARSLFKVRLALFAVEAATEVWPEYSPSGDSLAYLQGRPADFSLVVRSANGSGSLVVETKLRVGRLTWSRDGTRVCYGREGDFWCAGAAGGSPRLLMRGVVSAQFGPRDESLLSIASVKGKATLMRSTPPGGSPNPMNVELPESAREIVSALSPDGTRLVVADAQGDCWTVSLSEGRSRRAGYRTRAVSWFPDSERVMFAEMRAEAGGVLWIAEGDSGSQRRVLQTPSAIHSVSLRADGGRAVFATGNPDWDISEHKITGQFIQKVAASSAQETAPDWSSTGDRFLFIGNASGPYAVWIGARMIAPIGRSLYAKPRFSPDGRRVAYVDSEGVRVAPAGGGASVLLVPLREHVSTLCWSAAGEQIYFASQGSIWSVPSSGGLPAVIPPGNFVVDASSDGRRIAVSESPGRDLYSTAGDVSLLAPRRQDRSAGKRHGACGRVFPGWEALLHDEQRPALRRRMGCIRPEARVEDRTAIE